MKFVLTAVACLFSFVAFAGNEPTSVLVNDSAATAPQPAASCCECEEARVVKLAPWTVRRLNRVADRQEAREARNCCCAKDCCKGDCCCKAKPKVLVVENRKNNCNCCR